jgi:alkyl sulfatase BDS1-like metallo-beta-lactamase superfamily hydrolase
MSADRKPATTHTQARNAAASMPQDPGDFARAGRGFIAAHPTGIITDASGRTVSNVARYGFLGTGSPSPDTVHPSLWRHAQLNNHHGLFEVVPGIWQVRGYDISNITFIQGATGWVAASRPSSGRCRDLHAFAR